MNAMKRAVSSTTRSHLGAFLAAAALLFAGATGCGDSTDTSPVPDDNSTESAAAADQDEFVQAMHAEGIECDPMPMAVSGNPTCGDFDEDWVECKIEPVEDGTYSFEDFSNPAPECEELVIELLNANGDFDWESNLGIDAVFVKGGPGGNLYECAQPSTLGHDFTANRGGDQFGLSHVSFCFEPVPDVKVTKEAADESITVGDDASFDITIENLGTVDAENVTLDDELLDTVDEDVNWTIDSVTKNEMGDLSDECEITDPADDSTPNDILDCDFLDPLAPGDTIEVSVSRTTTSDDCGDLDNTAIVGADDEPEDRLENNEDSATTTVECPDVRLRKIAFPEDTVSVGERARFAVRVTNISDFTAENVIVTDTLPGTGWTIQTPDGGSCMVTEDETADETDITCNLGTLEPDELKRVVAFRDATLDDCGELLNTATVTADNDVNLGNNTDSATITVECPDVRLRKIAFPEDTVEVGERARFAVRVRNISDFTAENVIVTDTLPGTGWTIQTPDGGSCDVTVDETADETDITCDLGTLEPDELKRVAAFRDATADDCGELLNTASVTADNDVNLDNNTDSATITVECPDIGVEKTPDNGTVTIDRSESLTQDGQFTMVVTNHGPGTAFDVELDDDLPDSEEGAVNWSFVSTSQGTCDTITDSDTNADDVLHCDLGDLAEDASATVIVERTFEAEDDCGATFDNTVFVSASNEVDDTEPNFDDGQINVECVGAPDDGELAGCTPGYWKQEHHFDDWDATGFAPDDTIFDMFGELPGSDFDSLEGDTLLEALNYKGGPQTIDKARILLRIAVAAVLTEAHSELDFPEYDGAQDIIDAVVDALDRGNKGEILQLKNQLDRILNENECPLPLEEEMSLE